MTSIDGVGGIENQLSSLASQLGESSQIVRQMFADLDKFKTETDQNIRQETMQRIAQRLERLRNLLNNISGGQITTTVGSQLSALMDRIDSFRTDGTITPGDAAQVTQIQQAILNLQDQLAGIG
ncbi:MAG: hypothetical protein JW782_06585 [Candidatus Saganbacteria bacterium]|nr:hypothetical protein [Candidatus Saganbacteria bacterium]